MIIGRVYDKGNIYTIVFIQPFSAITEMKEIIEILNRILTISREYDKKLIDIEETTSNMIFSKEINPNVDKLTLKNQNQAFSLLRSYVSNQIGSIESFLNDWTIKERIKYLIFYDCHGLTNGKFYDYAVGHENWKNKRDDIYWLIEKHIEKFSSLRTLLKKKLREFIVANYNEYLNLYPSEIVRIIDNERLNGNIIIEASSEEYFKTKIFFKLKYDFIDNYENIYPNVEYNLINDIHYWKSEYQDYYIILASGFEKIKKGENNV